MGRASARVAVYANYWVVAVAVKGAFVLPCAGWLAIEMEMDLSLFGSAGFTRFFFFFVVVVVVCVCVCVCVCV